MKNTRHWAVVAIVALFVLARPAPPPILAAPAATIFTVDSTLDEPDGDTSDGLCASFPSGKCTLRAAIMQADATIAPDMIIIVPAGTYTLTRRPDSADGAENGDLNLTTQAGDSRTITLLGAGAASTIIDANMIDRVLSVDLNSTATLSDVTMRNGVVQASDFGGGVLNAGTLTITDSVIEGNKTQSGGGGIFNHGTLNITRSTIRSNMASLGGGLYTENTVTIRDSTIYGNAADNNGVGYGGGI